MRALAATLGVSLFVTGCNPAGINRPEPVASRTSSRVLTAEDLWPFSNAAQAIQVLRRQWVSGRSGDPHDGPSVFIDDKLAAGTEVLTGLPTNLILEIRYLQAWEAAARFGSAHPRGAVMVTTTR